MRHFAVVFLTVFVACKDRPTTQGAPDAAVAIGPPEAAPTSTPPIRGVIRCKSPDGKYQVDLKVEGSDPRPRSARVHAEGGDASEGVSHDRGFPPPNELTCSRDGDPSTTGCYVEHTSDYGYIVNVSLNKQGKRAVELRQNGVSSDYLATLDCER